MFERKRRYYSLRTGSNPNDKINLHDLKSLFVTMYSSFEDRGYLQEHFGYYCVDQGDVPGMLGADIPAVLKFHLRKSNLWPLRSYIDDYTEDDLFDMIEFIYDHVSFPLEGYYHQFNGCGYHYSSFNRDQGRKEFIAAVNAILEDYNFGYELSEKGEILVLAPPGMDMVLQADVPSQEQAIVSRINNSVASFRRYRSTLDDRRHAIRDLADVLEYLRPKVKEVLTSKDEDDLFNIANNFGIRHMNNKQKTNYDHAIWLSWMFYYYLATIHASLRLISKAKL